MQEIREHADYPGSRVRVSVSIGPWKGTAAWDVSTGDPIVPAPRTVRIDRVLGGPIMLRGYAPETTIAEKGVTILERGITSTRWRDYVDIVQLARQGIDADELLRSAQAVARGLSIPAQREANRRRALELRALVVAEFVERGCAGRTPERPEMRRRRPGTTEAALLGRPR